MFGDNMHVLHESLGVNSFSIAAIETRVCPASLLKAVVKRCSIAPPRRSGGIEEQGRKAENKKKTEKKKRELIHTPPRPGSSSPLRSGRAALATDCVTLGS